MTIINERQAKYYAIVSYKTPQAKHDLTLFFDNSAVLGSVIYDGQAAVGISQRHDASVFIPIADVVDKVFTRATPWLPSGTVVQSIQLWEAVVSDANTFVTAITPKGGTTYGSTSGTASAYMMFVFQAATRQKARITFLDTHYVAPQREGMVSPPVSDDGSLVWLVIRSEIPFATSDGAPLTLPMSVNYGYNRRLARKYGRDMTP